MDIDEHEHHTSLHLHTDFGPSTLRCGQDDPEFMPLWQQVHPDVQAVLSKPTSDSAASMTVLLRVYEKVYDYCVRPLRPASEFKHDSTNIKSDLVLAVMRSDTSCVLTLRGSYIHTALQECVVMWCIGIVEQLHRASGTQLLAAYHMSWLNFARSVKLIECMFRYLDITWLPHHNISNEAKLSIRFMCLQAWAVAVFENVLDRLTEACLSLINSERQGKTIDRKLVAVIINSYADLDVDKFRKSALKIPEPIVDRLSIAKRTLLTAYDTAISRVDENSAYNSTSILKSDTSASASAGAGAGAGAGSKAGASSSIGAGAVPAPGASASSSSVAPASLAHGTNTMNDAPEPDTRSDAQVMEAKLRGIIGSELFKGYKFYNTRIEDPYLETLSSYYKKESRKVIARGTITEYIEFAAFAKERELDRVKAYLMKETQERVKSVLELRLVRDHAHIFAAEFKRLLQSDNKSHLLLIFDLVKDSVEVMPKVSEVLENFIIEDCRLAIQKVSGKESALAAELKEDEGSDQSAGSQPLRMKITTEVLSDATVMVSDEESGGQPCDPLEFMETIHGVRNRHHKLIVECFQCEKDMLASLDKACRIAINRNAACKSNQRASELFARLLDALLRRATIDISTTNLSEPPLPLVDDPYAKKEQALVISYLFRKATGQSSIKKAANQAREAEAAEVDSDASPPPPPPEAFESVLVNDLSAPHLTKTSAGSFAISVNDLDKFAVPHDMTQFAYTVLNVAVLLRYIEDKDIFQTFYAKLFAKRLVQQQSRGVDAEYIMLGYLRYLCGQEFVSRLVRMTVDLELSQELLSEYLRSRFGPRLDHHMLVLNAGTWPFVPPQEPSKFPPGLQLELDKYAAFYKGKYDNRKLMWLLSQFRGEIAAQFDLDSRTIYTFSVNVYQYAIFELYNVAEVYTGAQIRVKTGFDAAMLDGNIGVLLRARILLSRDATRLELAAASADEAALMASEGVETTRKYPHLGRRKAFVLNIGYRNKRLRVNLNVPIRTEIKVEVEESNRTIQEDRRLLIQSTLMRLMKAERAMSHNDLIEKITTSLAERFSANISDILRCIEVLLEKEYIEKDPNSDTVVYQYVA